MEPLDKKKEILKAASVCFARYGYEKTTLDDIGKLVNLNKASLYYYYKNKESIYTEVIYSESNAYLNNVFSEVEKVIGINEKILTYLTERLKFVKNSLNFSQLSIDSVQKIAPLFGEMYNKIIKEEMEHLSKVLECSVKKGEIISCETNRIAKSIITISDAILNKVDCQLTTEDAYNEALNDIQYTVSLILDGLIRK